MPAGHSAASAAALFGLEAEQLEGAARTARTMQRRYAAAAGSERALGALLEPLEELGFHVLADRRWAHGRGDGQVDFVVVGPSGVFVVDAKSWADVHVRGDRIYQGEKDVTGRLASIASLAETVREELAGLGLAPGEVGVAAVFTNRRGIRGSTSGVDLLSFDRAVPYLLRGRRLTSEQIGLARDRVAALFPPFVERNPLTGVAAPAVPGFAGPPLGGTTLAGPPSAGPPLAGPPSAGPPLAGPPSAGLPLAGPPSAGLPLAGPPLAVSRLVRPQRVVPIARHEALITVKELEESLLAHEAAKPIEEWMAWLLPDQARLATRTFNGPSRIRGSAGTGKTVVGLHRAAHIARTRPGRVLVTTFVRTLPAVLSSLMQRMAPEIAERVDFVGVHQFARELLHDRGIRFSVDHHAADALFDQAWKATDGALARIDPTPDYWRDELRCVIKGRGIVRFEEYARLARVGRRRSLNADQRFAVWELHESYDRLLRTHGVNDYADLILTAERSLREAPLTGYSAVVIDEAQDLSCAMIRMLHHLVGDRADGLNLIGDGQQTIYPGGYTLSEIGINIAGRGVVLTRNYRNSAEILSFATSLLDGAEYTDIEGGSSAGDAPEDIVRHGPAPTVTRFTSRIRHDQSALARVQSLLRSGCRAGDIGILTQTNYATDDTRRLLESAGIPSIDLHEYRGAVSEQVKVGTIERAKGLEFTQVLVARVPHRLLEPSHDVADSASSERRELDRRKLYVAMTRARDGLWVGVV